MKLVVPAVLALAAALSAGPARADDLSDLLRGGPLVRIEDDAHGKLKSSTCIADVDAPIDMVWRVLTDYDAYRFFMPRVKSLQVSQDGADTLLAFELDTPLVSTSYTNRQHADPASHTIDVKQVKGDLPGSHYRFHLVSLGEGRTRIFYSGIVKNFSSIAERLDDEQQTVTIGVNVVSLMATVKAVKQRSELLERQAAAKPAAAAASGG